MAQAPQEALPTAVLVEEVSPLQAQDPSQKKQPSYQETRLKELSRSGAELQQAVVVASPQADLLRKEKVPYWETQLTRSSRSRSALHQALVVVIWAQPGPLRKRRTPYQETRLTLPSRSGPELCSTHQTSRP